MTKYVILILKYLNSLIIEQYVLSLTAHSLLEMLFFYVKILTVREKRTKNVGVVRSCKKYFSVFTEEVERIERKAEITK